MRTTLPWLLLAPAAWCTAAWVAPAARPLPELGRALARPLVLPWLWATLAEAEHHGSAGEAFSKGRLLLDLLPRWTDGHAHVASRLAFDVSLRETSPAAALEPLLAALGFLEEALARHPPGAADILGTMAMFLQVRCPPGSPLADAFRGTTGQDPAEAADLLLARALAALPAGAAEAPYLRDRRAWLAMRLIAGALRVGDRPRARQYVDVVREQLATVQDQVRAAAARRALDRLAAWLDGDPRVSLADLHAEPALAEVLAALPGE